MDIPFIFGYITERYKTHSREMLDNGYKHNGLHLINTVNNWVELFREAYLKLGSENKLVYAEKTYFDDELEEYSKVAVFRDVLFYIYSSGNDNPSLTEYIKEEYNYTSTDNMVSNILCTATEVNVLLRDLDRYMEDIPLFRKCTEILLSLYNHLDSGIIIIYNNLQTLIFEYFVALAYSKKRCKRIIDDYGYWSIVPYEHVGAHVNWQADLVEETNIETEGTN